MKGGDDLIDNIPINNELVNKVYDDTLKETAKESSGLLALIPRYIKSKLFNFRVNLLISEHNYEVVQSLISNECKTIDPDKLVTPEAYVAMPALNAISYSMEAQELRDMYAKLLSKAMYSGTKDSVHPAYVEIIKQKSPLDANILKLFIDTNVYAITKYLAGGEDNTVTSLFENMFLEYPQEKNQYAIATSISNLQRLGLLEITYEMPLSTTIEYEEHFKTDIYKEFEASIKNKEQGKMDKIIVDKGLLLRTPLGTSFMLVCILPIDYK